MKSLQLRRCILSSRKSAFELELSAYVSQGKIVRQESTNIDALYERKRKQADIQKKMYVTPGQLCLANKGV
jgi:hypothetical protein